MKIQPPALIFAVFGLVVIACSTSQLSVEKLKDPNLSTCSGTQARQKYAFTLSTFQKMPAGLPVANSTNYLDRTLSG